MLRYHVQGDVCSRGGGGRRGEQAGHVCGHVPSQGPALLVFCSHCGAYQRYLPRLLLLKWSTFLERQAEGRVRRIYGGRHPTRASLSTERHGFSVWPLMRGALVPSLVLALVGVHVPDQCAVSSLLIMSFDGARTNANLTRCWHDDYTTASIRGSWFDDFNGMSWVEPVSLAWK